jgi:hypothetical protein
MNTIILMICSVNLEHEFLEYTLDYTECGNCVVQSISCRTSLEYFILCVENKMGFPFRRRCVTMLCALMNRPLLLIKLCSFSLCLRLLIPMIMKQASVKALVSEA